MAETIRVTCNQFLDFAAKKYLEFKHPGLSDEQKIQKMPVARYNALVHGFHAGVALVATAVALVALAKLAAAVVFGALGAAIYTLAKRELDVMALPGDAEEIVINAVNIFLHRRDLNAAENVQARLGLPRNENWKLDRVVVCDMPVLKSYAPEAPVER